MGRLKAKVAQPTTPAPASHLGQRRSDAVKKMLVLLGAREAQLESVSLGEEKPACTESNEGCWAKNRRAHLVITAK